MKSKRCFALLLAVMMLAALLPLDVALAAEEDPTPLPAIMYWYDADEKTVLDQSEEEELNYEGGAEAMKYYGEIPANKDCHYAFDGWSDLKSVRETWTSDGETFVRTKYWRVAKYKAVLTHVEAKKPTTTEGGNIEHWHCDTCGKNYSDAEGKNEITDPVTLESLTTYAVTATSDPQEGGTVTGAGDYAEGDAVTLKAEPKEGYRFKAWKVTAGDVTIAEDGTFTMPANDVAVTALWEKQLTVIWLDGDDSELDKKTYWAGETEPTTDKEATKAQDEVYIYEFDGWDEGTEADGVKTYRPQFIQKPIYTLVSGANQSYRLKSGKNYELTIKRSVDDDTITDDLTQVMIGRVLLKKDTDYTVTKGSAVITITPKAINKIPVGTYHVTVTFTNGEVVTKVKILAAYDDTTGTGDNSHMFLWLSIAAFGCMGLAVLTMERKRLRER